MAGTSTPPIPSESAYQSVGSQHFKWVADAAGDLPDAESAVKSGHITNVYFLPGTTPPTNALTGFKLMWNGVDLLNGKGLALDTTKDQEIITPTDKDGDKIMAGFTSPFTVEWTGNAVDGANPEIIVMYAP